MMRNVSITVEGQRIAATIHERGLGKPECAVITCHGMLATRESTKAVMVASLCASSGALSLRFDFRGCGDSDGKLEDSISSQRLRDLDAVVAYVIEEFGIGKIGLFGSSLGGYVCLLKAGSDRTINTVVSVSSPYSMAELLEREMEGRGYCMIDGIRIGRNFLDDAHAHDARLRTALSGIDVPVLFAQGSADTMVPEIHARRLHDAVGSDKRLLVVEGADHSYSHPEHLKMLVSESVNWFVEKMMR